MSSLVIIKAVVLGLINVHAEMVMVDLPVQHLSVDINRQQGQLLAV